MLSSPPVPDLALQADSHWLSNLLFMVAGLDRGPETRKASDQGWLTASVSAASGTFPARPGTVRRDWLHSPPPCRKPACVLRRNQTEFRKSADRRCQNTTVRCARRDDRVDNP